ncbi:hypothetical protein QUH73_18710 [Labilibaculum sp. K2S]|uniref:hypothetical protein n=1 Tax=Labilibaculum sp. K2S TaxID=3056386 RepID=UPI0025A47CCA|nr:hypothetical protein [Labilibaculum sp. K2S]MDM8161855.1 hypothetical protein [Labilibaculum sp. K2S]
MEKLLVIIEKSKCGFCAYHKGNWNFSVEAKSIDQVKRMVNFEVSLYLFNKLKNIHCCSFNRDMYPTVNYQYNVNKLLDEVRPLIKLKTLADFAGLTSVCLSYYLGGQRKVSEKVFLNLVNAVHKITFTLNEIVGTKQS